MDHDFKYKEVETGLSVEAKLDVAAAVAGLVPLIGGPVASLLSGISGARKEQRILEVVQGVSDDLRDFQSQAANDYVKTEEFEELLENTLRRVADERNAEKRRLYGNILTAAIKNPGGNYDEQLRFVKMLEELDPHHIAILRALRQQPESNLGMMGSCMQTLRSRLPEWEEAQIEELVNVLNGLRVTSTPPLRTIMTAQGAADLRHTVTPYGQRFLGYILSSK